MIKPIETVYNGYKFRSRLEARWAVFFDAACIEYEYESQGHERENGEKYLPDFYLPDLETYVEVKGKREGYEKEVIRLSNFIEWGGEIKQIVILSDVPGKSDDGGIWHFPAYYYRALGVAAGWFFFHDADGVVTGHISRANYIPPRITEWDYKRDRFSIEPKSDYSKGMKNIAYPGVYEDGLPTISAWELNELTFSSFVKARQARFEHGERRQA